MIMLLAGVTVEPSWQRRPPRGVKGIAVPPGVDTYCSPLGQFTWEERPLPRLPSTAEGATLVDTLT
ncbi:hypothetical protein GCM10007386_35330 [Pseudoduganella dura]|nr:hypothetical protein GCM10007386_35330 [Pseudoduganella dura]